MLYEVLTHAAPVWTVGEKQTERDVRRASKNSLQPEEQYPDDYAGKVISIRPGYDPEKTPQFYVRPQRQAHGDNINYIFIDSKDKEDSVLFWIQDQYFDTKKVKTYHCYNCQAPQLLYNENYAALYRTREKIEKNTTYACDNCKESLTYMGIVKIKESK